MRKSWITLTGLLMGLVLVACSKIEYEETDPPGLAGVWGSTLYSRSSFKIETYDAEKGEWESKEVEEATLSIAPQEEGYTMLKFAGSEIWLMKDSPYFEAKAGVPYECTIEDGRLITPLFPPKYEEDVYRVEDLQDRSFKLVNYREGRSLATGDTIIEGYKGEITFIRLK